MGKRKKQDNKVLWVLLGVLAVCFIAILILFYKYFYAGTSSTKYGDRLENIEKYPLSKTLNKDIQKIYEKEDSIDKVTVNLSGRIIYITIDFKKSIKVETAQSLAVKSLEPIGKENLQYYEVQYILNYTGKEENKNFPVLGSKRAASAKVVW